MNSISAVQRRERKLLLEPLESRLAPAHLQLVPIPNAIIPNAANAQGTALPDIVMHRATTVDSRSLTVNYQIDNAAVTQPLPFNVYRSSDPISFDPANLVATATIPATDTSDLAQGTHQLVRLTLNEGIGIAPRLPYVIVVANPARTIVESNYVNDETSFRKHAIAVVTHGYEPSGTFPHDWIDPMVASLLADGFEQVLPFDWALASTIIGPGVAVAEGGLLAATVAQMVRQFGDAAPVDAQFIAHSRGAAVVSSALTALENYDLPTLGAGFVKMTLLDPHPGNNNPPSLFSYLPGVFGIFSQLGQTAGVVTTILQAVWNDPAVVVPPNVDLAEVYYQHTPSLLTLPQGATNLEVVFNLWGESSIPGVTHVVNLTGPGMGHEEVHDWYEANVVPTLGTGSPGGVPGFISPAFAVAGTIAPVNAEAMPSELAATLPDRSDEACCSPRLRNSQPRNIEPVCWSDSMRKVMPIGGKNRIRRPPGRDSLCWS
jgi:hypothetical protein